MLDARLCSIGNALDFRPKSAITKYDTKHYEYFFLWVNKFKNVTVLNI